MRADSISLYSFRSFPRASFEFSPGINVVAGQNAMGKTNLLEAVFLLCGGKSFRTRQTGDMIAFDSVDAAVEAEVFSAEREHSLYIRLSRAQSKTILRNGVKTPMGELSDIFRAVLFCPEDLSLIKAGPQERRRFLDTAISQLRPGYAKYLSEYNRSLDHKKKILRERDSSMLPALDEFSVSMCRAAARIIRYRAAFTLKLCDSARVIAADFTGGRDELDISYHTASSVTDPLAAPAVITEQLYYQMSGRREEELITGSCLVGAHKDDLLITINGENARSFASQGQTRTAALSMKLAERELFLSETGEYPVLLLDDVLSELDDSRQDFVLNRITGGQTLITCCEDRKIAGKTGGHVIRL